MTAPVNPITPAQAATFAKGLRDRDSFPRQFARVLVLLVAWPLVLVWKAPILIAATAVAVAAVYTARALADDWTMVAAAVVAPAVLLALWRTLHRSSFAPVGAYLLGGVRATLIYRPRWRRHTAACGLAHRDRDGEQVTPRLVRVITRHGRDELRVRLLPGQTPEQYTKAVPALAHAYRVGHRHPELVARVTARCHRSGTVTISFPRLDPLASVTELADVPAATDLRAVPFALGDDGSWRLRDYANVAGEVGGGVPGAGKTAGERALSCSLIQHPAVQPVVIDGKGGDDWSWIAPRAWLYTAEDDDLSVVLTVLRRVDALRKLRVETQKTERGSAEFWDLPLDPAHPLIVLTVDECQTYLDPVVASHPVKEIATARKQQVGEITKLLSDLVRKGRSVGIITRLLTQKPTADSLPTQIRDNASERTAWRVKTDDAARAILGDAVGAATLSPVDIPKDRRGMAVVDRADGGLELVRFPLVPGHVADTIAERTAHLRRTLAPGTTRFLPPTIDGHPAPPPPPARLAVVSSGETDAAVAA